MIVFSDLHLSEESSEVVLGKILPGIFEATSEFRDPVVACLGDFWDIRYKIDVSLLNAVRDELLRWTRNGIKFLFLPGNHDQVDVQGRNALEVFDNLGNGSRVYTDPCFDAYGLWIPYRKYRKDLVAALAAHNPKDSPSTLFLHTGIESAWMNDNVRDTTGIPFSMLDGFDRILSGHYHKRQTIGKVTFVGSPRQVTANESGQDKGFAILEEKSLRFVDRHWGKRFHRIRLEEGESLDLSKFQPGDDVRVSAAVGVDPSILGSQLSSLGIQHVVTPDVPVTECRLQVAPDSDLRDFALGYVDLIKTKSKLDKSRLIEYFDRFAQ